jgi:hypothetical protein
MLTQHRFHGRLHQVPETADFPDKLSSVVPTLSQKARKEWGTRLDSVGTPVGVQQRLMRHADIRTTMNIYGDAVTQDMREAQGKIVGLALNGTGTARKAGKLLKDGGRYRIRTYDFHRVKMALYR